MKTKRLSPIWFIVGILILGAWSAVALQTYKSYMTKVVTADLNTSIWQQLDKWNEMRIVGQPLSGTSEVNNPSINSITFNQSGVTVIFAISPIISKEFNNPAAIIASYTADTSSLLNGNKIVNWSCNLSGGANTNSRAIVSSRYLTGCF